MLTRVRNLKWFLRSEPDQSIVKGQPVLGKHADVDIDADGCPGHADGVCAVLQHVRHWHLLFFSRQSEGAARHFFRDRDSLPFGKQKDRINRIWIVDMIRGYPRSIGSAAWLRRQHLIKESAFFYVAGEDFSFVDVLIANGRCEIFPARIFRIGRRIIWIRRDMTSATRDTDAIRTDQLVVVLIARIVHETIAVPLFACLFIEVGIWKNPEAKDPRWFAVNRLIDACRFGLHLFIEPQAKFIWLGRGAKSGLIDQAQSLETLTARIFAAIQHLQEIH